MQITAWPYDPQYWPKGARENVVAGLDLWLELEPPGDAELGVALGPGWDPEDDLQEFVDEAITPRLQQLIDGVTIKDWNWLAPDHAQLILVAYDLPDMSFLDADPPDSCEQSETGQET